MGILRCYGSYTSASLTNRTTRSHILRLDSKILQNRTYDNEVAKRIGRKSNLSSYPLA